MQELITKVEQHVALAKQGIQPVTNFYAAFRLFEQAAKTAQQ